jgi:hypothetical protein
MIGVSPSFVQPGIVGGPGIKVIPSNVPLTIDAWAEPKLCETMKVTHSTERHPGFFHRQLYIGPRSVVETFVMLLFILKPFSVRVNPAAQPAVGLR